MPVIGGALCAMLGLLWLIGRTLEDTNKQLRRLADAAERNARHDR